MIFQKKHTGFAIAIAWPETWCKQSGAWYDNFLNRLGISKNHYYKVGHAALVLIDINTQKCHYFDFGRYHTPFNHGRVRSKMTDHGLKINILAQISGDGQKIQNFEEILTELQMNPECHGEGSIHASYGKINISIAFAKVIRMQQISPIRYGPFRHNGSNCSRFVNTALRAGRPAWHSALKLNFLVPLTPTTLNNVNSFRNKIVLPKLLPFLAFKPVPIADKSVLKTTLPTPLRPEGIPATAQWLSGEGAGSWFNIIEKKNNRFFISRYSLLGGLECESEFIISNNQPFNINNPYRFRYLSHCRKVKIRQNENSIEFERLKKYDLSKNKYSDKSNTSIKSGKNKMNIWAPTQIMENIQN
ncbi:hypothetical protein N9164_08105 [Draconibacterium sp.]|nr:hypothetical protein [Draconibacterium sp.]